MKKFFMAILMALLMATAVASSQPDTLKSGRGFQILKIRGKIFFRNMESRKDFLSLEEIAQLSEVSLDSLKIWAFENRKQGLWRGEFTPLQSLEDWRVLQNSPVFAVFYPTGEPVDKNGFQAKKFLPVVPSTDTLAFNPVIRAHPEPDTTTNLQFGDILAWMAFRTKSGYKCYPNCVLLYFNKTDWSLVETRHSSEWSNTPFGIMWDCGNTYRRIPQEPKVVAVPQEPATTLVVPQLEKTVAQPPLPPTITAPTRLVISKRLFLESAIFTGTIQSCQKSQIGQRYNYRLWLSGQESSLTYAEDRQTLFWINSIAEGWQVSERNEGLSPKWSNNTGWQYFVGPQLRLYHGWRGDVLKLAVTAGQRFAYNQQWTLLRPRVNFEKYALIGKKIGFQLEADAILSLKGRQEQVYFGNTGLFYSPKYRVKYWLGAEYTKVSAGNGGYASSGTFAVAKWESAFGLSWLTLIGKYRPEVTEVSHTQWNNPKNVIFTDHFEGIRWGVFAAIALKR